MRTPTVTASPIADRHVARALLAPALAALLALSGHAAQAQDDALGEIDVDPPTSAALDPVVFATLLPNQKVITSEIVASAIASVLMPQIDPRMKPIVPASPAAITNPALRPIHVDGSPVYESPTTLQLAGQTLHVHADGMPGPNAPSSDPFVRVLPREVNPADVQVGARWNTEEHIPAPLLSQIAWNAQADVFAGPMMNRTGSVRRSLRITAQWDNPLDMTFGITPGVEHESGSLLQHHVTALQATTVDKTQPARWHSFIEVSGEKLGSGSIIDNSTAQVHAGATYSPSSFAQLDVSVSRGTTPLDDMQSSIGLQMHF